MSKQSIIKGTLILTIAGIATKLLGFYNRIFLTRTIGVKELGIYQLVFPLYIFAFAISCSGFATALTKHVSFYLGQNNKLKAKKVFVASLTITICISLTVSASLNIFAPQICTYILKNSDCTELLRILTIAMPFVVLKANINSFFVASDHPGFQGFTNFFEQIIRIGSGMYLAAKWAECELTARLAVIAVITGEIAATVLSLAFYSLYKRKILGNKNTTNSKAIHNIIKPYLKDAIPITENSLLLTLFSSLETILIPSMLFKYYLDNTVAMEIYGTVTGIVIPFLLFPATISGSLSTMLLPAVSSATAANNKKLLNEAIKKSLMFCTLLGVLAWGFYVILGKWVAVFAFKSAYAGRLLQRISFICPLIYIQGTLSAILNGLGKAYNNLIINISGLIVRILITMTLVPHYGINAYLCGMILSYVLLDIWMLISVSIHKESADIHSS